MGWGGGSWGTWHTALGGACPQGCGFHTTDQAVILNDRNSEWKRAKAWARHKEWIGKELKQTNRLPES